MLRVFEERERAAETLFARAEQAKFLARYQGVQALALHAAQLLGVDRYSVAAYAEELMASIIQGAQDEAVVERVRADLEANGVVVEAATLSQHMRQHSARSAYVPGAIVGQDPSASRVTTWG